ncbi:hypothetical protein GOBAR_AA01353 [Gossypium barbadense]|uniref:Uncharacterized protein n=1 Tax=Gossypium barbadense TaxID=3634 RepID=A0A2P5YUC8_GOSBA|nr:hypothetical protein GOBAR_AA01353 [Gossypium barbadense]
MDSFPRSLNPNKHLREQFVSNLPGSSMLEVSALLNNVAVLVEWVYICMIRLLFLLILFTAVKRTYSLPYMEGPNASRASISSYRVVTVSYYLFFENHTTKQRSKHETRIRICLLTIMFCKILTLLIDRYVERISRRMCNLAYVTWVVAQNLQNTFIQDGKEMASVLYTYRSCVKALPQGVCWNSQFGIQKLAVETGAASIYCGF